MIDMNLERLAWRKFAMDLVIGLCYPNRRARIRVCSWMGFSEELLAEIKAQGYYDAEHFCWTDDMEKGMPLPPLRAPESYPDPTKMPALPSPPHSLTPKPVRLLDERLSAGGRASFHFIHGFCTYCGELIIGYRDPTPADWDYDKED